MATVTGFTAERMLIIENASIVDGDVIGDNLVLKRKDGSTIDAGSVRGPIGSPGVTVGELASQMAIGSPIGSMVDYIGVIAPTNWLTMMGQTIVNGQTLYPALWAVIPIGMKSGSSIVMPDTRGRVSAGYSNADTDFDVIGEIGGAKTHTITQAQLPAASISIDPPAFNVYVDPPNTSVWIDPPNTAVYIDPPNTGSSGRSTDHSHSVIGGTSTEPDHRHWQFVSSAGAGGPALRTDYVADSPQGAAQYPQGVMTEYGGAHAHNISFESRGESVDHTHAVDIAPFYAYCDIAGFNAAVDIAPFNAPVDIPVFTSGVLGSGVPHNILQPYVVFLKIIRAL